MMPPVQQRDPVSLVIEAVADFVRPYFPKAKWGGADPKVIGLPLTSTMFEKIADATPRIYIGWGGLKPAGSKTHDICGPLTFSLLIVLKNQSGDNIRLGDKLGAGLYPSLIAAAVAVHGRKVADVGSIEVTEIAEQPAERWSGFGAAAGFVSFQVNTSLGDLLGEGAAAAAFRKMVSEFELVDTVDGEPSLDMGGETSAGDIT